MKPLHHISCFQVGEKLGKFEVEKRQAIESEDYDKAKLKKQQMEEYRDQMYRRLELSDLIEETLAAVSPCCFYFSKIMSCWPLA